MRVTTSDMLEFFVQDDDHNDTYGELTGGQSVAEEIIDVPADEYGSILMDSNLWVLIGFLIVIGIMQWQKVPSMLGGMLKRRATEISDQLDEARSLREEAQKLLADYQKRQREAEDEAASIIEQAKEDAKNMAKEARAKLDEQLTRRKKAATDRIARAEAQAINEMRAKTADLAIAAAREIIASRVDERAQTALIDKSIADVRGRLN
ncbi:F0F1 ATP synthase subunit B [Parvularcula sp. LCG005]|uniref:F0F1 ATP synthase subunit B family protein n=1 Tax=Parvularcula sp. LCG005 TaxID=3078805 RepID=UPI0029423DE9|nr:F0F1 ATP synthase subunit B [Parvularcula sp. LCG005]WOI52840.1 F0F1 ATP synthase subunit B [Parvularcula sp. LCG005]